MALSKSIVNNVNKTELYFNKYIYKASITSVGIFWIRNCETIENFKEGVSRRYEEWDTQKDRYPHGWYKQPMRLEEHNLFLIDEIITLKNRLKGTDTRFRHEHETLSLYTNDESLIEKLVEQNLHWCIDKADVSPTGVKYFKKDPPAKYRAYMTTNKVEADFCNEMIEYLNRTPDLNPSNAFYDWLHRRTSYMYTYVWLWNNHFIDYNDERNLMMMKLMFPKAIGRTYKLEKKP